MEDIDEILRPIWEQIATLQNRTVPRLEQRITDLERRIEDAGYDLERRIDDKVDNLRREMGR